MSRTPRAVVKVDKLTLECVESYPSCTAAAAAEGLNHGLMSKNCKDRVLGLGRYFYRYVDDFMSVPEKSYRKRLGCPVILQDWNNGRAYWFPSMTALSEVCDRSRQAINNAARDGWNIDLEFSNGVKLEGCTVRTWSWEDGTDGML